VIVRQLIAIARVFVMGWRAPHLSGTPAHLVLRDDARWRTAKLFMRAARHHRFNGAGGSGSAHALKTQRVTRYRITLARPAVIAFWDEGEQDVAVAAPVCNKHTSISSMRRCF